MFLLNYSADHHHSLPHFSHSRTMLCHKPRIFQCGVNHINAPLPNFLKLFHCDTLLHVLWITIIFHNIKYNILLLFLHQSTHCGFPSHTTRCRSLSPLYEYQTVALHLTFCFFFSNN